MRVLQAAVRKAWEERESVSSSNVRSLRYDPERELMEVRFNHGGTYYYRDVPEDVFEDVLICVDDGSVGRTLHRRVKEPGYEYERVDGLGRKAKRALRRLGRRVVNLF